MITLEDLDIGARTIFGEARGEPYEGMKAVAHVILNRCSSNTGQWVRDTTIKDTCQRKWQFSCWNDGDPTKDRVVSATYEENKLRECMKALLDAIGERNDPTKGAHHYMTIARHKQGWPNSWGPEKEPDVVIGNHEFFVGIP